MTPESLAATPALEPISQRVHPDPPSVSLPTMYDLPSEDPEEPGLPDEFHDFQPHLLRETFKSPNYPANQVFVGTDLNLYYDVHHPLWQKRPDWFVVLGVSPAVRQEELRWSYVIWQEGVSPFLVVELLSPGTQFEDLGQTQRQPDQPPTKWEVYERILRIPYYVVFDRTSNLMRAFQLVATRLEEIKPLEGRLWLPEVQLGLGIWQGVYQETEGQWLRWYKSTGEWIPTAAEQAEQERQRAEQERQRAEQERQRAEQERQRAEQERQRAEQERQRADRLTAYLRQQGIDPETLELE